MCVYACRYLLISLCTFFLVCYGNNRADTPYSLSQTTGNIMIYLKSFKFYCLFVVRKKRYAFLILLMLYYCFYLLLQRYTNKKKKTRRLILTSACKASPQLFVFLKSIYGVALKALTSHPLLLMLHQDECCVPRRSQKTNDGLMRALQQGCHQSALSL